MSSESPNDLRALRARIRNALPTLPGSEALLHWLDGLPLPTGPAAEDLRLEVSVSADVQRVTLSATAPAAYLVTRTARFLAEADVSDKEMAFFASAFQELEPARLGSWIEIGPLGIDGGWLMPGPMLLDAARAFVPAGEPQEQLLEWTRKHDITTCLLIKRSVGDHAPYTELVLPLPGGDVRSQLSLAQQGFEAMGALGLPEAVSRAVARHSRGAMSLSAWLVPDGLAKAGILLTGPDPELQSALMQALSVPEGELDRFNAALGRAGPDRIEVQELADGVELELHFSLTAPEPTD